MKNYCDSNAEDSAKVDDNVLMHNYDGMMLDEMVMMMMQDKGTTVDIWDSTYMLPLAS